MIVQWIAAGFLVLNVMAQNPPALTPAAGPEIDRPPIPTELPPLPPSPIQEFRNWLRMSPEERNAALKDWPEAKRVVIQEKLRAYEALPREQRERRLAMLELRWYLRPLMAMPPGQRSARLNSVPLRLQEAIQDRLAHWDRLDPQTQRELLKTEDARELLASYYAQIRRGTPEAEIQRALTPGQREELRAALQRWGGADHAEQQRAAKQLARFFELPREEQTRALNHFPESERREIQSTLNAFARLSPEQRRACVNSFQKFATMAPEERTRFLRNAARWQEMTPTERKTWKELVTKLPPLPPDFNAPPMPPAPAREE